MVYFSVHERELRMFCCAVNEVRPEKFVAFGYFFSRLHNCNTSDVTRRKVPWSKSGNLKSLKQGDGIAAKNKQRGSRRGPEDWEFREGNANNWGKGGRKEEAKVARGPAPPACDKLKLPNPTLPH